MRISDWSSDVCSSDLAVEERGAAAEVVGHAQQLQRLFQRARLMVAAEQDAEVAPRRAPGLVDEVDLAGHALGFVHAVAALPDPDAFAVGLCAQHRLGVLVRVRRKSDWTGKSGEI